MPIRNALKDILAGSVFIAFGLAFAAISLTYEVGSALRMGPGYFPLVLGGILVLLGLLIIAKGFVAGEGEGEGGGEERTPLGTVPWRPAILIVAALVFFGVTVRGLGLAPSLFVTTLLSAFADEHVSVWMALLIAGGLTILCVLIFVVALQLRLPLVGPWIPV